MTRTHDLRAYVLSGKPFTPANLAVVHNLSTSAAHLTMADARVTGYEFEQIGPSEYRCVNPSHRPSEAQIETLREGRRAKDKKYKRSKDAGATKPPLRPDRPPTRPTPEGQTVADQLDASYQKNGVARQEPDPPLPDFNTMTPNGILGIPGFEATGRQNFKADGLSATPPRLGGKLEVFAMVMQDDGSLRLGIQNGERKWVVDVVAELARP